MEAPRDAEPSTQPEPSASAAAAEGAEERQEDDENDVLMAKAQSLMDKITASPENPSPNVLHALSTILEAQESSYMEDADQSSTSNGRSSHNIGRLGNLIRENEEFFELITSRFLSERRYSVSVQAATARLLFSCSLTWMYPHVFEDDVLANLRGWVMEEIPRSSGDERHWKPETGKKRTSDFEILRMYSTALLAVCLSWELLLLMHEHLQASGLTESAATLLKEAKLTPLPSLAAPSSLAHQSSGQEASSIQIQWPSARAPCGFLSDKSKHFLYQEDSSFRSDSAYLSSRKKTLASSAAHSHSKLPPKPEDSPAASKINVNLDKVSGAADGAGTPLSVPKFGGDGDTQVRTPIVLPMKCKLTDVKECGPVSSAKRLNTGEQSLRSPSFTTPTPSRRSGLFSDAPLFSTPISTTSKEYQSRGPNILSSDIDDQLTGLASSSQTLNDPQPSGSERLTLDSLVIQYLKHQHRQCPAPITTLPPLSLLQPHVCPEPRRSLDAPSNVTSRLSNREFRSRHGGMHGLRKDRQFVYSRFRPWRSCRDDASTLLTCISFLGDSSRIAAGGHTGELKVFDSNSNIVLDSCTSHQSPVTLLQSHFSNENQLILSSSAMDVRLWDASSVSGGPKHSFEGIKAARFSNSGGTFAALRSDSPRREILLYDIHTCQLDLMLSDTTTNVSGRGHAYSMVHFSPSDSMVLWNGVLWDRRGSGPVHRFDQFTDYGGGGFHPAGNEVIINSEVWDLRKFRLLRSVPSLDQTTITFNASGDVIYGILRRNLEDVTSAFNTRRVKHPLFSAFRTVDAVNYSDIATIPVDRCVLDFATEPTDSFVGLITMDDQDEMYSSARVYEIGRRKPTDDDSDPDDAESEEEEDDEGDDDSILDGDLDLDGDSDGDDMSNDDDSLSEFDDDEEDGDFIMDGVDFDGSGILEIVTEGDDDDDDSDILESFSSGDEDDL